MKSTAELPSSASPSRRLFAPVLLLVGLACWWLKLSPTDFLPSAKSSELAARFFGAALQPALTYEDISGLPQNHAPFLTQVARAAVSTLRISMAAVTLSVIVGLLLGFLASQAWWPRQHHRGLSLLWISARGLITFLRSVHELIWATIFLAALGLSPLTAIVAIALPYSGTLAKIFSEMCDEAPADVRQAFIANGSSPLRFFLFGLVPRISPELISYALYRFECGLRSTAILGFIGIPTLGLGLSLAFENAHYREVWTHLYALLVLVLVFDQGSAFIRRRLSRGCPTHHRRQDSLPPKPIDLVLRVTLLLIIGLVMWAWVSGNFFASFGAEQSWQQRSANFSRFLQEIRPWPVQQGHGDIVSLWVWLKGLLFGPKTQALLATINTLALSVVAIALAGFLAQLLMPFASRTVARAQPWIDQGISRPWLEALWRILRTMARLALILARSIPEYIWAFLFMTLVAHPFAAAILALAFHNAGILGRLGSEILDNAPSDTPRALRALGASRFSVLAYGQWPQLLARFLVYFFYRWETCLRESTILGLLGVATLGRLIKDARAMDRYDEMILFVLFGAILVFLGDLISSSVRRRLRKL